MDDNVTKEENKNDREAMKAIRFEGGWNTNNDRWGL
jgi:hypothetical protein